MARGNDTKTQATYACKQFDYAAPTKKPAVPTTSYQPPKKTEQKKDYGSWGPIFKDKKTFTDMHFC